MASDALKIGFVFDDSLDSNDGVSQYVKTLGEWLSHQGHQVSYLVGETKLKQWAGGKVYSLAQNKNVTFNDNRLSIPLPVDQNRIKGVLKAENFDVLHVQVPYSPFMAQRVINKASRQTAIVGTFHIVPANHLASWGSRLLRLTYGRSLKRFDSIISVSPPAADFARRTFGLETQVISNAVNIKRFDAASNPRRRGGNKIVFLGRLVKRKGCQQLLKAFELLYAERPDTRLIIGGDGPLRSKLERFVNSKNLTPLVSFIGFVDEIDKPTLLASADIACFPATGGESFGIVLVEAMAAGAGVVAGGDNPGYRSVLNGRPEMLVQPNNSVEFAKQLKLLLDDSSLSDEIHDWQQLSVRQYDIALIGPKLLKVYREAIAKHRIYRA